MIFRFWGGVAGEEGGAAAVGRPPPSSPAVVGHEEDEEKKLSCRATLSVEVKRENVISKMRFSFPFSFLNGAGDERMGAKWLHVGRPLLG